MNKIWVSSDNEVFCLEEKEIQITIKPNSPVPTQKRTKECTAVEVETKDLVSTVFSLDFNSRIP
jgi:hypothetical protein